MDQLHLQYGPNILWFMVLLAFTMVLEFVFETVQSIIKWPVGLRYDSAKSFLDSPLFNPQHNPK